MTLIAPTVVRYTLNGSYLGRPTANIIDFALTGVAGPAPRAIAARELATRINFAFVAEVLGNISNQYTITDTSWVDLDTEDGSTGSTTVVFSQPEGLPKVGGLSGEPISANTAMLVDKSAVSARGKRSGRLFMAGAVEGYITGNTLNSNFMGDWQASWDDFLDFVTIDGQDWTSQMVVVHTRNAGTPEDPNIVFNGTSPVIALQAQSQIASQRRRNRR